MNDEELQAIKARLADWLLSSSEDAITYGESIAFLLADDERLREREAQLLDIIEKQVQAGQVTVLPSKTDQWGHELVTIWLRQITPHGVAFVKGYLDYSSLDEPFVRLTDESGAIAARIPRDNVASIITKYDVTEDY